MSGEVHQLQFVVATADTQHWTNKQYSDFGADPDQVVAYIRDIMVQAANEFVAANHEMFLVEVM